MLSLNRSSALTIVLVALVAACSSSDSSPSATAAPADGGTAPSDGGPSKTGDDGGDTTTTGTVSPVALDQPANPVYLGALPSGNLIATEGAQHRVIEIDPAAGKVVAVNDTDFTGSNWPRHVAVDTNGHVFINGYQTIILYANGIKGSKTEFVPVTGNKPIDNLAWGGTPKRLWATTANNPVAPKTQIVRYDAATDTAGGTPTVVGEVDTSAYQSMAVDDANNAYLMDFNACRIVKVTSAGVVSVVVGKPLGQSGNCVTGAYGKNSADGAFVGQGSALGLDPTGQKILYSDPKNHVLLDVSVEGDGLSRVGLSAKFADTIENGFFVASKGVLYVVDNATHGLMKVTF